MHKTGLAVVIMGVVLTACSGKESVKVQSLQKKDKHLSCSEVMLEINEAEFYRRTAEKNKTPGVSTLLMPLGYISTYMDAENAKGAADARIDYLNRIYEILRCDEQAHASRPEHRAQAAGAQPVSGIPSGYVLVPKERVMIEADGETLSYW